jgi:hypothetical protein
MGALEGGTEFIEGKTVSEVGRLLSCKHGLIVDTGEFTYPGYKWDGQRYRMSATEEAVLQAIVMSYLDADGSGQAYENVVVTRALVCGLVSPNFETFRALMQARLWQKAEVTLPLVANDVHVEGLLEPLGPGPYRDGAVGGEVPASSKACIDAMEGVLRQGTGVWIARNARGAVGADVIVAMRGGLMCIQDTTSDKEWSWSLGMMRTFGVTTRSELNEVERYEIETAKAVMDAMAKSINGVFGGADVERHMLFVCGKSTPRDCPASIEGVSVRCVSRDDLLAYGRPFRLGIAEGAAKRNAGDCSSSETEDATAAGPARPSKVRRTAVRRGSRGRGAQ